MNVEFRLARSRCCTETFTRSITEARVRADQKYGWWDMMKTSSLQESHLDIGPTHDCVTSSPTPQRLYSNFEPYLVETVLSEIFSLKLLTLISVVQSLRTL